MNLSTTEPLYLLSPSHLESATETMAAAFQEDPLWRYIYPDGPKRERILSKFFKAVLTLSITQQNAYGIGNPTVAVAVWDFPGQTEGLLSPAVILPFLRLAFSSFAISALLVRKVFSQFERMQRVYAPGPHYYLQTIGVRPYRQGQGYASRLIRPFLNEADSRSLACYTETVTPNNVSLYEYFGFKVVEHCTLPKIPFNLWGFYRPAKSSSPAH